MDDYKVLKVKYNAESKAAHHLYFKRHQLSKSSSNNNINERTLFVSGVPPYYTEDGLKQLFHSFGRVDQVAFYSKPVASPAFLESASSKSNIPESYFSDGDAENDEEETQHRHTKLQNRSSCGFKVAYVLFNQPQSATKAMQLNKQQEERVLVVTGADSTDKPINGKDKDEQKVASPVDVGMRSWIEEYKRRQFVDAKRLQLEIDTFMQNYDEKKTRDEEADKLKLNEPDEDGWMTVSSKSRKAGVTRTLKTIEKLKAKEKKKRQQMQLVNFYSFQMRESKKDYIAQLRKKFEEDKKRIESMKTQRKFKPF